MNPFTAVQTRLAAAGLYSGAIDGKMGPVSMTGLQCAAAGSHGPTDIMRAIAAPLVASLVPTALITPLRICHVLAQMCVETDGFKTLVEYGEPVYFARYDGRADLGNSAPGDGFRFRGRGPLQLTTGRPYRPLLVQFSPVLGRFPQALARFQGVSVPFLASFRAETRPEGARGSTTHTPRRHSSGQNRIPGRKPSTHGPEAGACAVPGP